MNDQPAIDPNLAAALFITYKGMQGLAHTDRPFSITAGELIHYIWGSTSINEARVESALSQDLVVRGLFNRLVSAARRDWINVESQADDGSVIDVRQCDGFRVEFKGSKADPSQVYLILRVETSLTFQPDTPLVLHLSQNDQYKRIPLPPPHDRMSQIILPSDDEKLACARAPGTVISLVGAQG